MTERLDCGSKGMTQAYISFPKMENIGSRWKRVLPLASKVGKGLSIDSRAQLLATKHWLEAIDPLHRYGENLKLYFDAWLNSQSSQPFFFWLDFGHGKKIDLVECSRAQLQRLCIRYLGHKEREEYEVIIQNGKLIYKQNGGLLNTPKGMKYIYVLSTSRKVFVGIKNKGVFQHSSFLAGATVISAGRLVVSDGILQAIWAYSGHYCPTEESFQRLIQFLDEQQVDLKNVKLCAIDDDVIPTLVSKSDTTSCARN
ncbi:hypothetical protein OROHE_008075 [Orobanche hederae]